jgi:hypothetical protein
MQTAPLAIALLLLGVGTRAVEDREMKTGQLDGHEGAWLSGVNGASKL